MGQNVEIRDVVPLGQVLMVDTDRSFTGQDGEAITPGSGADDVPGLLAQRLFELDMGIDHVFVLQNQVTLRRSSDWDDDAVERVSDVIRHFLRYYPDEPAPVDTSEEE